ncbi:chromate efflux transporter [Candidatus Acetothermia bacterium]|jgi:chromate transporter|nr:chromate efflux transporter [Candidatus Acetothermia bacterium]MCI2432387.1 chromate efflux transporter [Candidatus Acetothermia bacterium]MCI2437231.1 chromate efflux transporter [Candidatus Acetothermia bacterium]
METPHQRIKVPFKDASRFWLKLGFISFGGPAGQIAMMHREVVERRRWMDEERFLHALNYCMLLPGPEAQQLATYLGYLMHGIRGGLVAGLLFVLPSFFILLGLAWAYRTYGHLPALAELFWGLRAVVVGIVAAAVLKIGQRALKSPPAYLLAIAGFVGMQFLGIPFPIIVFAAGLLGLVLLRHQTSKTITQIVLPPFFVTSIASKASATTLALAAPAAAVTAGLGATLLTMAWFFTSAALVTFGGAYAVLPYVAKHAEEFGWMTQKEMIDGLALTETTPGPLIMYVTWVGYMGAGVAGAVIATFFTFLPSFLFIFLGAPYVERLRGNRYVAGFLSGVTAAVVGVILSLAVHLGQIAFKDLWSLVLALTAFILLMWWPKLNVVWAVLMGLGAGLIRLVLL